MQNNDSYSESCLTLHITIKLIKPGIPSGICDDNNEWQSFIKKQIIKKNTCSKMLFQLYS